MLPRLAVIGLALFLLPRGAVCDRDSFRGAGFAYGSSAFEKFVDDSYKVNGGDPREFYRWFDASFKKATGESDDDFLAARRLKIQSLTGHERVTAELELAASIHKTIRKMLPFFSLKRGYEFSEAARHGKRQCLLQSVLIASLLQKAGLQSGIVMIFRRPNGETCNNSHNVVLMRLSNDAEVLVDASEQRPFAEHRGLLVRSANGAYQYVDPVYRDSTSGFITGYEVEATKEETSIDNVSPLDDLFIESQFDYYRAERTEHGVMGTPALPSGLKVSIEYLERSVRECPQNPLAVYVLGRAYRMVGNREAASEQFRRAKRLYSECGWMPESVRNAR